MFEIGSSLREARTRQGLDFNEMEFRTKVRAKYLRALEAEQFDQLPGHTYIKGFLRTYADALGMDGQLYVDEYNSRFVTGDDEAPLRTHRVPTQARRPQRNRESRFVMVAVIAIVIVTALVIAAWKFGGSPDPKVAGVNAPAVGAPAASVARSAVSITANRGASFMEVRTGGGVGTPLYRGTLERGQTKRFTSRRLLLTIASPGNVVVRVGGERVQLPSSGHLTISPSS